MKHGSGSLSVVIITYNEAEHIGDCLHAALQVSDDVVIIDSFSTDRTPEICREFGVKLYQQEWMGFGPTKNLGNEQAHYNWILSLDADEVMSEELIEAINTFMNHKADGSIGFGVVNRKNLFCGQWIRYCGWYPDYKARLFHRHYAYWSDDKVHEELLCKDDDVSFKYLNGALMHYSFATVTDHVDRINRYSSLKAEEKRQKGESPSVIALLVKPPAAFLKVFLLKGGFLEGWAGLIISVNTAYARYLREVKLWSGKRRTS